MRDDNQIKRLRRAFLLYEKRAREINDIINMRGDNFGIAVSKDFWALRYQQRIMGLEILRAYVLGETPNWYHAFWLSWEEKKRRTDAT